MHEGVKECKIWLGEERMEEVSVFKYLGTVLCKHGKRKRGMKGKHVIGTLDGITKGEFYYHFSLNER